MDRSGLVDKTNEGAGAAFSETLDVSLLEAVRAVRRTPSAAEACRCLDETLRPRLVRYFKAHSFRADEVEDLVQTTLVRVFSGMAKLESEERFLGWLFVIARNVRLSALSRKRRRSPPASLTPEAIENIPDPRPGVEEADLDAEAVRAVQAAIESLPDQQRRCVLLRMRDDLPYGEIAATLGLSVNTVRNHLAAARQSLRARLKGHVEGDLFP